MAGSAAIRTIGDSSRLVLKSWHHSFIPAIAAALLAIPAQAQQPADNGVVGAPELRDFTLPGARVESRPVEAQPETTASAPAETQAQPVTRAPVTIVPPPAPSTEVRRQAPVRAPVSRPSTETGGEALPPDSAPATDIPATDTAPLPAAAPDAAEPSLSPADQGFGNTPWIALGLLLAGLLGFAFYRRGRQPALVEAAPAPMLREAAEPAPRAPMPAPVARLKAQVASQPKPAPAAVRPWLEMEFKPDRMVATDEEASVHFLLTIKNVGKSHARNVRIVARMFNAGPQQQQEIEAFFAYPERARKGVSTQIIPHGTKLDMPASVALPKADARVYNVGGKPIFVPMVAVTILYDWTHFGVTHSGQTSQSYVVGVEPKAPAEKMGPFRLDLGPRIYRSVGQRQNQLARTV